MDDKAARMAEQLKANPAMLKSLMQSQDAQGDQGASLQKAVRSATKGDTSAMVQMVNQIMQSPSGAALVERINKAVQK